MNCAYHSLNAATVNCNGCGKPLCPACDHRIKGFPFCQNCIVDGVDLLRNRTNNPSQAPFIKKRTSPLLAFVLSVCPGLGAAYNGQTSKAVVYFGIVVGLFQLAFLFKMPLFFLGGLGMWAFSGIDAWRTAQMIRAGLTPEGAEDIIVQRFAGNPKLWGLVLLGIGSLFFLQMFINIGYFLRSALPVLLIALGIYLLRDYIFKDKKDKGLSNFDTPQISETSFRTGEFDADYREQSSRKSWKSR